MVLVATGARAVLEPVGNPLAGFLRFLTTGARCEGGRRLLVYRRHPLPQLMPGRGGERPPVLGKII